MSALPKKKNPAELTNTYTHNTQTQSRGDHTVVGDFSGQDMFDTKKFELVPVLNFIAGTEKGRIVSMKDRMIIGRSRNCDMPISDPSCSRQHAVFERRAEGFFVEDLKSTNGVKVNGVRILSSHELHEGDRVQLGDMTVIRFGLIPQAEANLQQDVYQRATRDGLTGAYNRKSFDEAFEREISHSLRNNRGMGLILFDIDFFKKVNDTHGHAAGDEVLRKVSEAIQNLIRTEDLFARIGGEEFALLTRNETVDSLTALAERVRSLIELTKVRYEANDLSVTISIGLAFVQPQNQPIDKNSLFTKADAALYEAKNTGRNRVVVAKT